MWRSGLIPNTLSQTFEPPPDDPIWAWADQNVWLSNKEASESGPYRSAKTPWTRRLQEIGRTPYIYVFLENCPANAQVIQTTAERLIPSKKWDGYWLRVRISEFNIQKSSQSGFSEAILNVIRWRAKYRPCNTIYSIDTKDEAQNISERLTPSLKKIDSNVFTGDDDDVGTYVLRLRAMDVWFMGSFSTGKFANKQAPLVVADELEEHGKKKKDTSSSRNLSSRKKTAAEGLHFNLSKPKMEGGPINALVKKGNQEMYFVPCPHCKTMQPLTFESEEIEITYEPEHERIHDPVTGKFLALGFRPLAPGQTRKITTGRVVFEHCKDSLGNWDQIKLLEDTFYECSNVLCKGTIREHHKQWMIDRGEWWPTAQGETDVISQYCSDLYSTDSESTHGKIAKEFVGASKLGRRELQGVNNHRFGKAFKNEVSKMEDKDITGNIAGAEGDGIAPYTRGNLSFEPWNIILGSDVGGNYARWVIIAVLPNEEDAAVIDWGDEIDPSAVADVMVRTTWKTEDGQRWRAGIGFMDGKFRKTDVYKACLSVRENGQSLIPYTGAGGVSAKSVKMWTLTRIPTYGPNFLRLDVNDREAKNEMYITYLKKKIRRLYFPTNVAKDPTFVAELCAEELIEDEDGQVNWKEHPGPNHYGDCIKNALMGLRFITRRDTDPVETVEEEAAPAAAS